MKFTKTKFTKFFKKLTDNDAFNVSIALIILLVMPVLSILANSDLQEYHYSDYEETITTYGDDEEIVSDDNDETTTEEESTDYVITTITDDEESTTSTDESETTTETSTYENFKVENKENVILNNKTVANNENINKVTKPEKEENVTTTTKNVVTETKPPVTTFETTTKTTTAVVNTTTTTENIETTTSEETTTTTTEETTVDDDTMEGLTYLKSFSKGTYYSGQYYSSNPSTVKGGSGRTLVDCSKGDGTGVKGSIASNYIQRNYGYKRNGGRTLVYIECEQYPDMNGTYYLDDSQGYNNEVIDFYYYYNSNCPFQYQGVITVEAWLVD